MEICRNKLETYNIPKEYLTDKSFSYKFYLNLCNISFWGYKINEKGEKYIQHKIKHLNITELSKMFKMNRATIIAKFKKEPYEQEINKYDFSNVDINDDRFYEMACNQGRHLIFNAPTTNYILVSSKDLEKLIELNEMEIRLYIYIYGNKNKSLDNIVQTEILKRIGYSNKASTNRTRLAQSAHKLNDLKLIDYTIFHGEKKCAVYSKITNNKNRQ